MNERQRRDPSTDPAFAPLLAMLDHLSPTGIGELARALHAKLNTPPTAAERRVDELGSLARVLEERPQYPEVLPYIPRNYYDQRRLETGIGALSARLVERYGSWPRACHAAWGLLQDGRRFGTGQPWPRPPRGPDYTVEECIASVRECAAAIGHIPSSIEYHRWVMNRRARARTAGRPSRAVHISTVYRLLAPERKNRQGWQTLVLPRVFGTDGAPPPTI